MSNWCFTDYVLEGDKDEIQDLYSKLLSLEQMKEPLIKNGFGKNFLGCVAVLFGGNWREISCRGEFGDLERIKDTEIHFHTITAWSDMPEIWELALSHYKTVRYYFCAEEPGNGYYATNDAKGIFFPDRFLVEQFPDEKEFHETHTGLFRYISERIGVEIGTIEEMNRAIERYNEAHPDNEIYVNEYEVV